MTQVALHEATRALRAVAPTPHPQRIPLDETLGRTLAEPHAARADVPGRDAAAMDGYACRAMDAGHATSANPVSLEVVGASRAGAAHHGTIGPGQAVAVATGAVLPEGADAIAVIENAEPAGNAVRLFAPPEPKHVRRSGEDLERAVAALPAGLVLDPVHVGLLAAFGHGEVAVARRPRVRVLPTGPELVAPGGTPGPEQVFESNGALACALLRAFGADPEQGPSVGDDEAAVRRAADQAGDAALLVTTGGASVGRHDAVRRVLEADGDLRFGGIRVRPGRPAMMAVRDGVPWLALPGTPHAVAVLGTLLLGAWAHAALGRAGEPPTARRVAAVCDGPVRGAPDRTSLWLARTHTDGRGVRHAVPVPRPAASRLTALADADALIEVPPGPDLAAGATVALVPFGRGALWAPV
ncbi:MAG: molybdopterin molybdotransferase MoeA [Trueperaceae bacterium]|nr:molybdopterin molybdotransferase MoeA [Trueperaceae bacterium]